MITRKARVFSSLRLQHIHTHTLSSPFSAFLSPTLPAPPSGHPSRLPSPLRLSPPPRAARPVFLKRAGRGEINAVLGEGITQLNFDESRRKKEEGRTSRGGRGRRVKRGERGKEDSISAEERKRNAGAEGEKNGRNAGKYAGEACASCKLDSMLAKKKVN